MIQNIQKHFLNFFIKGLLYYPPLFLFAKDAYLNIANILPSFPKMPINFAPYNLNSK